MINLFKPLLFNDIDYCCCGSLFDNKVLKFQDGVGSMFYTVNPIDGRMDHGYKDKEVYNLTTPRRADINVSSFRNFIFEIDTIPLEDQMRILEDCGIEWTTIVFSGNKSYHAILALEDCIGGVHTKSGIEHYKKIWKRVCMKIESTAAGLGFKNVIDTSTQNPSRFTRYPGTIRDNGNEQKIVKLGKRYTLEKFNTLLATCPKIFTSVVRREGELDVKSIKEFFAEAPQALSDELRFPIGLSSNGQYPRIYRLALWCLDLGVSRELCIELFEYRLFKKLTDVGYREDRLMIGVEHAFRKKY